MAHRHTRAPHCISAPVFHVHTHTHRNARTLPNLERSSIPVQMAHPCVYSEGSYWVTADICSGDGGWWCWGVRDEEEAEDGGGGVRA